MANGNTPNGPATFWTQANALLRKNLTYQKRNVRTNVRLILFPFFLCILLVLIQKLLDNQLDKAKYRCGCICTKKQGDQCLEKTCGIQHSDLDQVSACPITNPPEWPPFLQLPAPQYRAVRTEFLPFSDVPNPSCRTNGSCPVTMLFTGTNHSFGQILSGNMIPSTFAINNSDFMGSLATNVLCTQNSTFSIPVNVSTTSRQQ
ncbi:putative ABC transporter A family member 7-like, partial [Sesbania bispinosa]